MADDKRELFRTQRERIHAGRRVDTTDGMRLIQTALRDWPAPRTIPARAPYGHTSLLHRQIGGANVPGEIVMIAPTPETCREWGHEYTPRDDGLLAYISHPKGGTGAKPRRHTYTYAHIEHDLHCSVYRGGVSYGG